jgi:hypothetical protein
MIHFENLLTKLLYIKFAEFSHINKEKLLYINCGDSLQYEERQVL